MHIRDQLDRGEQILWEGPPEQGLMLRAADIFLIPFSLLWSGFVLFWNAGVFGLIGENHEKAPVFPFQIFGLTFLAVGLYFTIGRFFFDALRRLRTQYAVTDSRALILSGYFRPVLKSQPLTPDLPIEVSGRDRGSIKFGPNFGGTWFNSYHGIWQGPTHPFMFERIRKVREVYQLVRDIQRGRTDG
jgi:hypothetical protein